MKLKLHGMPETIICRRCTRQFNTVNRVYQTVQCNYCKGVFTLRLSDFLQTHLKRR